MSKNNNDEKHNNHTGMCVAAKVLSSFVGNYYKTEMVGYLQGQIINSVTFHNRELKDVLKCFAACY